MRTDTLTHVCTHTYFKPTAALLLFQHVDKTALLLRLLEKPNELGTSHCPGSACARGLETFLVPGCAPLHPHAPSSCPCLFALIHQGNSCEDLLIWSELSYPLLPPTLKRFQATGGCWCVRGQRSCPDSGLLEMARTPQYPTKRDSFFYLRAQISPFPSTQTF